MRQLKYEGFTIMQATYGVTVLKVKWSRQAGLKAKEYLDLSAFSRSGLIKQLKEYEGFTLGQATYGVTVLKANWNRQAGLKAKAYLDSARSRARG